MPEMAAYCGQTFRVARRAGKTCVEGHGLRRMTETVFLEGVRCDGGAHDGCERDCLIFWKEKWLRLDEQPEKQEDLPALAYGHHELAPPKRDGRYVCQSTCLAAASAPMSHMNFAHLIAELRDSELDLTGFVTILGRWGINRFRTLIGIGPLDVLSGERVRNSKGRLGLAVGDEVEVLNAKEIQSTLDPLGRNCGLSFEPDMVRYLRKRFRVSKRVTRIIREDTGYMVNISHTVKLEGVYCAGVCAKNCPRANPHYWREAWLKRVG